MVSKPRIMHVIDHTFPGGTQSQLSIRIKNLCDKYDFSVAVLGRTGRYSQEYRNLGIPVHELGGEKGRWNLGVFFPLLRLIRIKKPDIIHGHLFKSMVLAPLAAWFTDSKSILHDHSGVNRKSLRFYFPKPVHRIIYSMVLSLVIRLSSHIVVFTNSAEEDYIQEYKVEKKKIDILPNSIDLGFSAPTEAEVDLNGELNLSDNSRIIIMVGRLSPEKDWLTFLKVAKKYPDTGSYAFIVVGSGAMETSLKESASELAIKNLYFLGERHDVPRLLKQAHVFMLTSRQEAFGNVILEAMVAGCPVIASRTPGPSSMIQHEKTGLLVEIGDVKAFAMSLDRLLTDPELAKNLADNAISSLEKYSSGQVSAKLDGIYKQILQNRSQPSI